jgi:hypothetical protein
MEARMKGVGVEVGSRGKSRADEEGIIKKLVSGQLIPRQFA